MVYSGSNVKNFDVRSDITYISAQTITLCDTHTDSLTSASLGRRTQRCTGMRMPLQIIPQSPSHQQGVDIHLYIRRVQLVRRVPRNYETQTATFSVTANGSEILYCEYYREHSTGQKEVFHPNTTYYDMYMGNYIYSGPGNGDAWEDFWQTKSFQRADTIEIEAWYKINPTPAYSISGGSGRDQSRIRDMASALAGQTYYDNESAWWDLSIKLLHSNHRQRRNAGHSPT